MFRADFGRVLDHVGADQRIRQSLGRNFNASLHRAWPDYYTNALAERVHRASSAILTASDTHAHSGHTAVA